MSFLSKLFKAKQPETLEQRIAALHQYDQPQLLFTAQAEEPDELRVAAIGLLEYSNELLALASNDKASHPITSAARRRLGELLDNKQVTIEQVSGQLNDQHLLLALCGYSSTAGIALIAQIDNEELLTEVAKSGSTTLIRQAASQRIERRSNLEEIYQHAKNKDKSVYKIIKAKLEVFKEEKAREAEIETQITSLCHQAEQLNKRDVDDIFTARLAQLTGSGQVLLAQSSPPIAQKFHAAVEKCQAKLDEFNALEALKEAEIRSEKAAKKELLLAIETIRDLAVKLVESHDPEQLTQDLQCAVQAQEAALKAAQLRGLNTLQEQQNFAKLKRAVDRLLQQLVSYGAFPKLVESLSNATADTGETIRGHIQEILTGSHLIFHNGAPPGVVAEAVATLAAWQDRQKQRLAAKTEQIKLTSELLRKGNWAISKGHVGRARAILRDIEEAITRLDHLPSHMESKFEELKISIEKLGDWHEFAVTPKKQALVDEMQKLVASKLQPKDLAEKIQTLQNQWKELCKGGQNQDETLWQAFRSASQEAYEPCKKHFEEQSQVREQNAAQRRTLIQQLSEYVKCYDWESANWPEVEKTLKISREAWLSYWPVARKDIKTLQGQFDLVMDALYGKLNAEHENNKKKKQSIVDLAEKLKDQADTHAAIEEAKRLQQQWRVIGHCKRKDDQQLWNKFREYCDGIFERRQQENDGHRQERETNKDSALSIIAGLESMALLDGDDFFSARSELEALRKSFQDLGELPREKARGLAIRYQSALERIDNKASELRQSAAVGNWQKLLDFSKSLHQLECAESLAEEQISIFETTVHDHNRWPGDTQKIVESRLQDLRDGTAIETEASNRALRLLCIKAEVAHGLDTPESDKSLRMEYQVAQLQQNFGQSDQEDAVHLKLVEQWLAVRGGDTDLYGALLKRFSRALGW